MRITVLFFAHLRELVQVDRASLDLPEGATVEHALEEVMRLHPSIAPMRGRIAVAVNERYQPPTTLLSEGCIIGLIPPVSGG